MSGKLYVVGTPIGNLGDLSPRAVSVLGAVDYIAAEDTRVTIRLLNHFGIKTPLLSYHEHNKKAVGEKIVERLLAGSTFALVSDAGMPAISDPGEDLVNLCHTNDIAVESVPGPSAVVTALALSGLPTGRFCFEGFLSVTKTSRRRHLEQLKNETRTIVFYEAPHKLLATLNDLLTALGDRDIALVKELTKLHERVHRTTLSAAAAYYAEHEPKGEYVLIISPAPVKPDVEITLEQAIQIAQAYMNSGMSASAAAKAAAADTGLKKGDIYKACM